MEEQTIKSNTNYSPLLIIGALVVMVIVGIGLIKPREEKPMTAEISATPTQTEPATMTETATVESQTAEVSPASEVAKGITLAELSQHSTTEDCWVAINSKVYDVTMLIASHPGGAKAITNWCGKDGSTAFNSRGGKGAHPQKAIQNLEKALLGLFEVRL